MRWLSQALILKITQTIKAPGLTGPEVSDTVFLYYLHLYRNATWADNSAIPTPFPLEAL